MSRRTTYEVHAPAFGRLETSDAALAERLSNDGATVTARTTAE